MRTKTKPVLPNLSNPGVRRVSRSTVTATRATIEADERLRDLLGVDEPAPGRRASSREADRAAQAAQRRGRGRAGAALVAVLNTSKAGKRPPAPEAPRSKNSRAKGKTGELEFKELLREAGWPNARRGQQRAGVDQADVIDGPPGVHFEVKRVENLNVWAAHEQATRDAPAGHTPIVAMRRNRSSWLAVLPMHELLQLLKQNRRADSALDALLS